MKEQKLSLNITFPDKKWRHGFLCDCLDLLSETTKFTMPPDDIHLYIECSNQYCTELFNSVFGDWIAEQLFKNEICNAAKKIQFDIYDEELDIVFVGALNMLSDKLIAIQDIVCWIIKKYTTNNDRISLSTFVKMNTLDVRKDIKYCIESSKFKKYLSCFIPSIVDLRNESNAEFFRNVLKHKLLTIGDLTNNDHPGTLYIDCQDGNLRASTKNSYIDNKSLGWININGDGSLMTPEQFISFAVLAYNPDSIVIYPFEDDVRLKQFVNEHRVFFGETRVELWQRKSKT